LGFQRFLKTPSIFRTRREDGSTARKTLAVHFIPRRHTRGRRKRDTRDALREIGETVVAAKTGTRLTADGKRLTEDGKRGAHMTVDAIRDRSRRVERGGTAVRSTALVRVFTFACASACLGGEPAVAVGGPASRGTGKGGGRRCSCLSDRSLIPETHHEHGAHTQ